jgi:hypothetical protein
MPIARATCSALALVLVLGACSGGDDAADRVAADTTLSTTPPASTTPAAGANRIAFTPVGSSTLAGDISVEGDDNGTEIDVTIRNSVDGAVHKGHVHSGTCSTIGGVVAPLGDITIDGDRDGDSETDVQIPMATVMNGQHIVVYHEAGGTPGAPAVCVAIPAHS